MARQPGGDETSPRSRPSGDPTSTSPSLALALALALLASAGACYHDVAEHYATPSEPEQEQEQELQDRPHKKLDPATVRARLPDPGGPLAPALTRAADVVRGDELAAIDLCSDCHGDIVDQWRSSAHAWASFNNPIYRASIERFQGVLGRQNSRACAACHDPALLVDGAIDRPVTADDPRAHVGVSCMTCHGIDRVNTDGNGSYHLARSTPQIPDLDDASSIAAHRREVRSPALRSGDLCGSCHRAFVDATTGHPSHFTGADDLGSWQSSAYAGHPRRLDQDITKQSCIDCHMPTEAAGNDLAANAGKVTSHRFLGGHTWLAAMRGDPETAAKTAQFLRGAASLDITAIHHGERTTMPADAAPVITGEHIEAEIVIRNLRVGHRFPGGTRDAHDTRLEVELRLADGSLLARSDAHRLRSGVLGEDGRRRFAREVEDLRASAYDHTIAPRDATVVRFALQLPQDLPSTAWPLRLEARLLHRSRSQDLSKETCRSSQSPKAAAFLRASEKLSGDHLDPCIAPPEVLIAETQIELGQGAQSLSPRATWQRLYELGLGLEHEVQERLDRSKRAYEAALELCDEAQGRAMIVGGLASIAARQGRVNDALALTDELAANSLPREDPQAPIAPAIDVLRGQALTAVWRFDDALAPLSRIADSLPGDPLAWRELALAYGSAGSPEAALQAAQRGLELRPRDAALLRTQALALRSLAHPDAAAALDAYLLHRPADSGPELRSTCSRNSEACALERLPVHTHELILIPN